MSHTLSSSKIQIELELSDIPDMNLRQFLGDVYMRPAWVSIEYSSKSTSDSFAFDKATVSGPRVLKGGGVSPYLIYKSRFYSMFRSDGVPDKDAPEWLVRLIKEVTPLSPQAFGNYE